MAISTELFMAILAMDSYNRGYNPGITASGRPNEGMTGTQLGTATIGLSSYDRLLTQSEQDRRLG
jgi:hypothetical protein